MQRSVNGSLAIPTLQAILDVDTAARAGWDPAALAQACLDGGARFLQVRAKHLPSGALLTLCESIVRLASPHGAVVIVNDRVDVARVSGAAGAHVGQDDLAPADARALLGADAILGYSTHGVAQFEDAVAGQPLDGGSHACRSGGRGAGACRGYRPRAHHARTRSHDDGADPHRQCGQHRGLIALPAVARRQCTGCGDRSVAGVA